MPKPRRKKPRRCAICKATWKTYTLRDRLREKIFSATAICPACYRAHGWKPVFDAAEGGSLPPNLRTFEAARPHARPRVVTRGREVGYRGGTPLYTLKILADGRPHTFAELAVPGENQEATVSRLRRLVVAGTIRKTSAGWILNDSTKSPNNEVRVNG